MPGHDRGGDSVSESFISGWRVGGLPVRTEGAAGQHDWCDRQLAELRALLAERDAELEQAHRVIPDGATEAPALIDALNEAAQASTSGLRLSDAAAIMQGAVAYKREALLSLAAELEELASRAQYGLTEVALLRAADVARERAQGKPESPAGPNPPLGATGSAGDGTGDRRAAP